LFENANEEAREMNGALTKTIERVTGEIKDFGQSEGKVTFKLEDEAAPREALLTRKVLKRAGFDGKCIKPGAKLTFDVGPSREGSRVYKVYQLTRPS
jgi:hypothetical protein